MLEIFSRDFQHFTKFEWFFQDKTRVEEHYQIAGYSVVWFIKIRWPPKGHSRDEIWHTLQFSRNLSNIKAVFTKWMSLYSSSLTSAVKCWFSFQQRYISPCFILINNPKLLYGTSVSHLSISGSKQNSCYIGKEIVQLSCSKWLSAGWDRDKLFKRCFCWEVLRDYGLGRAKISDQYMTQIRWLGGLNGSGATGCVC